MIFIVIVLHLIIVKLTTIIITIVIAMVITIMSIIKVGIMVTQAKCSKLPIKLKSSIMNYLKLLTSLVFIHHFGLKFIFLILIALDNPLK